MSSTLPAEVFYILPVFYICAAIKANSQFGSEKCIVVLYIIYFGITEMQQVWGYLSQVGHYLGSDKNQVQISKTKC